MRLVARPLAAVLVCLVVAGLPADGAAPSGSTVTGTVSEKRGITRKSLDGTAVWLLRPGLPASPPQQVTMDQRDRTFVPHVVSVAVGGTVVFRNSDRMEHTVYSESKTARFYLGQKKEGDRSGVKVARAGVIDVRCDKHAEMLGWVVVVPTPYHGVSNAKGQVSLREVPPGTYDVYAWSEQYRELWKGAVTVSAGSGAAVTVEFTSDQKPR